MARIDIRFGGMTNVPDANVAQDGDMHTLLNMRHVDGDLVNISFPEGIDIDEYEKIYSHGLSGKLLGVKEDGIYDVESGEKLPFGDEGATNIEFCGNIVCIYRNDTQEYAIWRGGRYEFLGELPREVYASFDVKQNVKYLQTQHEYYIITADTNLSWYHVQGGFFDQALDIIYKEALYVDSAMFVVAGKLFDGSYIQLSPYYLIYNGADGARGGNFVASGFAYSDTSGRPSVRAVTVRAMDIKASLTGYDFKKWEGIITSVDIFSTGSVMFHSKLDTAWVSTSKANDVNTITGVAKAVKWQRRKFKFVKEDLVGGNMYRVESYDLVGKRTFNIEDTSPSNMAVQPALQSLIDSGRIKSSRVATMYNRRMHRTGVEFVLAQGYTDIELQSRGLEEEYEPLGKAVIVTTVKTSSGEVKVKTETPSLLGCKIKEKKYLSPLITYPDPRATHVEIILVDAGKQASYDLQPSAGFSFYLNVKNDENVEPVVLIQEKDENGEMYGSNKTAKVDKATLVGLVNEKFPNIGTLPGDTITIEVADVSGTCKVSARGEVVIEETTLADIGVEVVGEVTAGMLINVNLLSVDEVGDLADFEPKCVDDMKAWDGVIPDATGVEKSEDILYVSAVDNPFYSPDRYKFEGQIRAVASSAEDVSSGQFGQYPMNVFTDKGIWAMSVDTSGKVAYSSQVPISRSVCNGEVKPVRGGVVFPSIDGLMLLTGSEVTDLSKKLRGWRDEYAGVVSKVREKAITDNIEIVPFADYMRDAKIGYNYLYNELFVMNKDKGYSYRFGLDSGAWSVSNKVYENMIDSYPELLFWEGGKLYKWIDNYFGEAITKPIDYYGEAIYAITRPIKIGTSGTKRVMQAALRGTWTGELYFYVLGSNDGVYWHLLGGREFEYDGEIRRDFVTGRCRGRSCRYVAIAIASPMFLGRISKVELEVVEGIDNKRLL